jgi:Ser/Thr protein kinase RdoA (MazF antagonist)
MAVVESLSGQNWEPLLMPETTEAADTLGIARQTAFERYGLVGELDRLSGEKDANFRLRRTGQLPLLLKIVSAEEDHGFVHMHTLALQHVESRDPSLPIQRVVRSRDGSPDVTVTMPDGTKRVVRIVTYVLGTMQRNAPRTTLQRRNAGRMLARLQRALADFRNPGEDHELAWDLMRAPALLPRVAEIADHNARRNLVSALEGLANGVLRDLDSLPRQVVHNDLNSDNIVVDPNNTDDVVGIIDFGDMVRTARVFDVAVGAAYQMGSEGEPYEAAWDFVAGVNQVFPLTESEIDALVPSIIARMAQRLIITELRARRHPENRDYILRNTPGTWGVFNHLINIPRSDAEIRLRKALQQKDPY